MPLFLAEIVPQDGPDAALDVAAKAAVAIGAEFVEAQVTSGGGRVFAIFEAQNAGPLKAALIEASLNVDDVSQVRLVGADLETIKAQRPTSGYLVEWDLPEGLTMDAYLARKKEKSPLYAQVPEITFQRTYVREDMVKCLCFYDAPDEGAVVRAREVVSAPIDRLHKLDSSVVSRG